MAKRLQEMSVADLMQVVFTAGRRFGQAGDESMDDIATDVSRCTYAQERVEREIERRFSILEGENTALKLQVARIQGECDKAEREFRA